MLELKGRKNNILTLMAVNLNVNVSLIILYVARINGRLMDKLDGNYTFTLFFNVNGR